MIKFKEWSSTALLVLMAASIVLHGCGSADKERKGNGELTFVSANNTHGTSLDPAVDYCGSRNVHIGVCETLFKLNDDTLDVEPHLAGEYEHIDDCTWKITIRDGIYFSNGKLLTAEIAKAALEYELNGIARLSAMMDVASMDADGQALTIRTNVMVATLPRILTDVGTLIFDPAGTEDYSAGVIGTGPYILESTDDDGNCELVKNENYWQGVPGADRVHTKFIADASAVTLALQSGELDFASIQTPDISLFENNDDYEILDYETGRVYFLYLNLDQEYAAAQDSLRRALSRAFDRRSYLDAVYDGRGKVTTTIFPEWSGYSTPEVVQEDYDIDTAKQILRDAGFADSDGDGFIEKDGKKASLKIMCYPSNGFVTLGEVLQASLLEIGIDSSIVVSDSIVADLKSGDFDIATYGYTTLTMGDCFNFMEPVFRTGGSSNFNHFSNRNVDALLDELKATSDVETRKQLAIEMQKYIYAETRHVFLLHIRTYKVVRTGVQNVTTALGDNFNLWKIRKQ
jgi:peptide/nickel transport system substrate-binding protein